jgi:hypothetical protein
MSTKLPQPPPAGYVPGQMPISPPPPPRWEFSESALAALHENARVTLKMSDDNEPTETRSGWGCVVVLLALTLFWWGVLCGVAAWLQGGGGP